MLCVLSRRKWFKLVSEGGRRELFPGAYIPVFYTMIMYSKLKEMRHTF